MKNLTPIIKNLLIINVLMFMATIVGERYGVRLSDNLGLHFVLSDSFNAAQLFTYMFMHGSFSHLFFNMFAVYMFGSALEMVWGPKRFLFYYLLCGVGAGLIQEAVTGVHYAIITQGMDPKAVELVLNEGLRALNQNMNNVDPQMATLNLIINGGVVGASGAVYGILLAFAMMAPNQPLYIFPLPFPIPAKYMVIGYAILELMLGMSNNPADHVAPFAHLGGMLVGLLIILYWRKKQRNNGFYTH